LRSWQNGRVETTEFFGSQEGENEWQQIQGEGTICFSVTHIATTALFSVRPMKEISIQNSLQHLVQLSNIKNLQEFCRLYFSSILCGDKKTKKKKPIGRQSK
jgi:hypothetical protein